MYQTETDAFMFLHDQVLADYVTQVCFLFFLQICEIAG